MKLIRITKDSCSSCIVMREVMRRVMPEFPEIEIEDLDLDLDDEEVRAITTCRAVPYIKIGNREKIGSCTMDELREFLREAIAEELKQNP